MGDPSGWLIRANEATLHDLENLGTWSVAAPFEDVTVSGDAGTVLFYQPDPTHDFKHGDVVQVLRDHGLDFWEITGDDIARRRALHRAQCRKDDARARQGDSVVNRRRRQDRHAGGRALKDKRRNLTRRVRTGRRGR